jgi:hypothetical protein
MGLRVSELLILAGLAGAAWLAYGFWQGYSGADGIITVRTEGNVRGSGAYDCDVVGESHYQRNLTRLAGGRTEDSARIETTATLVLDDKNPHDSNAVKVYIGGLLVGHMPREYAASWRGQLRAQGLPVGNYTCSAMIVGGWDRGGGDRGHFGVKLDLPVRD